MENNVGDDFHNNVQGKESVLKYISPISQFSK